MMVDFKGIADQILLYGPGLGVACTFLGLLAMFVGLIFGFSRDVDSVPAGEKPGSSTDKKPAKTYPILWP